MIARAAWIVLWAVFTVVSPTVASAQEVDTPVATDLAETETTEDFDRIAERAEMLAQREDASLFAIGRLRSELVTWRDRFLDQIDINAGRIATVDAQLAALGPVPEDGVEPASIAARRAELIAQRQELRAPGLLAQEAHARANGLISEFDTIVQQREAAELSVRNPIPLNPVHLIAAASTVISLFEVVWTELGVGITRARHTPELQVNLPRALLLLASGLALLTVGRRVVTRWRGSVPVTHGRLGVVQLILLSLVQIIVPILGLIALTEGLQTLGIFGLRGGDMLDMLPAAGGTIILGWWLARHIFPETDDRNFLEYDARARAAGRRYAAAIAWVMAITATVDAGLRTVETSPGTLSALFWPALTVLGFLLWRLGRVIRTAPAVVAIEGEEQPTGRRRNFIGRICIVIGFVAPLMALVGYYEAGRSLLISSIVSLALLGLMLVIQRVINLLSPIPQDNEDGRGLLALLPVMVGLVLFAISLPVLALIWGARVDDIIEVWTRFRDGLTVGETRISPADFLRFLIVFALGYLLTRGIQSTLRSSVLPRTRLDLGAQNAIVAGFGYVGILLAAIVAISTAGIDLSNIAIVAGALSVGIGFGLQNIVSNFVSGIILLIERPVSEGDWIEVAGQMGYVRAISVRSTRIETFDRTDVIIPNADLVSGQVTNWTRGNLVGRVIVPVGVAYGSDIDKVTRILQGIAEAHPMVIVSPPPAVLFQGFGADSLDFEIRAILRDVNYVLTTKSEMNHEIAKQFAEAGIEIPFAQRDIWLRNPEVLKGPA